MGDVIVFNSLSLDGVIQAPGRPDEDPRDGFKYGGWAVPYADPEMGKKVGENFGNTGGLLLGRRTYEDFYAVWPKRTDSPFSAILINSPKYVASRTLKEPLPWENSILLKGDAVEAVAELKKRLDKNLVILGSGKLIESLLQANLIDTYTLLIHPLVLGSGHRMFPGGNRIPLKLVEAKPAPNGVVIATYKLV